MNADIKKVKKTDIIILPSKNITWEIFVNTINNINSWKYFLKGF